VLNYKQSSNNILKSVDTYLPFLVQRLEFGVKGNREGHFDYGDYPKLSASQLKMFGTVDL
jgi:hypothetical protein